MQRHLLFLLITMLCTMLNGCSKLLAAEADQPLLLIQKTPCLGTCPAYNATMYENGSVQFVGFKNAVAEDTLLLQLTEQEIQLLKQKLRALNYKELQSSYLTGWSDVSSTYLTFYEKGKEVKRVKHQEGGPQQLILFQEWLHDLIWQKAKEKALPTY